MQPWQWFWLTLGWKRGSHHWYYRHPNVKPTHNLPFLAIANTVWQHVPRVLSVKFATDGSTQNVSESVTQKMIAWKISSGCTQCAVTGRGDTREVLDAVNNCRPNLQFTLETTDDENSLPSLDMSINVQSEGTIFCTWYQKPTDSGTILNYRISAHLQHKNHLCMADMPTYYHMGCRTYMPSWTYRCKYMQLSAKVIKQLSSGRYYTSVAKSLSLWH